jgi:hypothetical protein
MFDATTWGRVRSRHIAMWFAHTSKRRAPARRRAPSAVHRAARRVRPGRGVDRRRPGLADTGRWDILVRATDTPVPGDPVRGSATASLAPPLTLRHMQPVARTATGPGRTRTMGRTDLAGAGSPFQANGWHATVAVPATDGWLPRPFGARYLNLCNVHV